MLGRRAPRLAFAFGDKRVEYSRAEFHFNWNVRSLSAGTPSPASVPVRVPSPTPVMREPCNTPPLPPTRVPPRAKARSIHEGSADGKSRTRNA